MKRVVITGADRGIGYCLTEAYLESGAKVYAGQYMEDWPWLEQLREKYKDTLILFPLDVSKTEYIEAAYTYIAGQESAIDQLVNVAGVEGWGAFEDTFRRVMMTNTIGPLKMTETFLPLLSNGEKRICFFSSEAGINSLSHRTEDFTYCSSKTMLNMEIRLMFNRLRPEGFTFRIFHPGWVRSYMTGSKSTIGNFEPEESAAAAFAQFNAVRSYEDVLVMTDISGETWPF